MNDLYRVRVCVRQFRDSLVETFNCETLAASAEEAESNIRERFRHSYAVSVNNARKGI